MEPKFGTSFIPKKSLSAEGGRRKSSAGTLSGVLTLIAFIILLVAIVLSVGAFLYQQLLTSGIQSKGETLNRARAAFEPELIEELVRLDNRLESAGVVLNEHIAPTSLFALLEGLTLQSVQFKTFDFSRVNKDKISISMRGSASNFNGIALQADILGKSKVIGSPIFSNLNIDKDGRAVFNFSAIVNPATISYVGQVDTITSSGSSEETI